MNNYLVWTLGIIISLYFAYLFFSSLYKSENSIGGINYEEEKSNTIELDLTKIERITLQLKQD